MAHEMSHRELCLSVNQRVEDETEEENGFLYWSNHPRNHANSEIEAYLRTLAVLEPWFEAHCGG